MFHSSLTPFHLECRERAQGEQACKAQNLHFKSISVAHLKVNVRGEDVEVFEYEVWDDNQGGWCDEARLPPGVRPLCSGEL